MNIFYISMLLLIFFMSCAINEKQKQTIAHQEQIIESLIEANK